MSDLVAQTSGFRMLWADDQADLDGAVRAMLAGIIELNVASDADAVLALVQRDPPALVCVAASLFTRDGVPLLRALRAQPSLRATTLMLSCPRGEEASLPDELLACADDLLLTPLSASELTTRLQGYVRRWHARRDEPADLTFLSGLGHELRTPLTAILLWASSLRSGASSALELEHALRCIAASAQGQARRIDDLLDLSRLAAGRLVLSRRATCVSTQLRSAWDELWPLAAAKHVSLALELAEPLGEVVLDPGRMQQVLSNLLSNAIKFTNEGGTVRLRARRHEQILELEVSDTGEGIAPSDMPRLFERFRQGSGRDERRHAGLGIGLALSRQLVELHGGSIEADSAGPGQGASFRVRLPVPRLVQAARRDRRAGHGSAARPLSGRTILLVEDHDETREAMQFVLERAGGRVLAVDGGLRGLALLGGDTASMAAAGTPVDVIVCDLGLPDISGYEFIARVAEAYQRDHRSPPASCAVSAHARELDRQRAIEAGFDLHLAKPVTAMGLMEAVDDLCQLARTPAVDESAPTFTV